MDNNPLEGAEDYCAIESTDKTIIAAYRESLMKLINRARFEIEMLVNVQ